MNHEIIIRHLHKIEVFCFVLAVLVSAILFILVIDQIRKNREFERDNPIPTNQSGGPIRGLWEQFDN